MTAVMAFTCSICGESSQEICVFCTKDTCDNHMCQKCHCCSDCCVCETPVIREKQAETVVVEEAPLEETVIEETHLEEPRTDEQSVMEEESLEGTGI